MFEIVDSILRGTSAQVARLIRHCLTGNIKLWEIPPRLHLSISISRKDYTVKWTTKQPLPYCRDLSITLYWVYLILGIELPSIPSTTLLFATKLPMTDFMEEMHFPASNCNNVSQNKCHLSCESGERKYNSSMA